MEPRRLSNQVSDAVFFLENEMPIELSTAQNAIGDAASRIFDADPLVRSVGVGAGAGGYRFVAVRNTRAVVPMRLALGAAPPPTAVNGIPVDYVNSYMEPTNLSQVPHSGPASPGVGSLVPEQLSHSALVCGLQIQNFDDDFRTGLLAKGLMTVGSLGCFVRMQNGNVAVLSNNHVIAGENHGIVHSDRILHPGGGVFVPQQHVATLTDFARLQPSPAGASIAAGNVVYNDIDAAIAELMPGVAYSQSYLPARKATAPQGMAAANIGDQVHKIGRTTGLTFGVVKQIGAIVGPVGYAPGPCWFQQSIVIEGVDGTTFSDHGDSGSAIVRSDGVVIGLLYAGNGTQTYVCPIANVLSWCGCQLV